MSRRTIHTLSMQSRQSRSAVRMIPTLNFARFNSTRPTPSSTPPNPISPTTAETALSPSSRLAKNYPRLVQLSTRTGVPLPSLAISFLILHEITAFIPLFLFFWLFQAIGVGSGLLLWIKGQAGVSTPPVGLDGCAEVSRRATDGAGEVSGEEEGGWKGMVRGWYDEAEVKIGKIGSRYGIFGYEKRDKSGSPEQNGNGVEVAVGSLVKKDGTAGGTVANAISAYVVVKALLPLRIAASIGLAPAFARFALNPIHRLYTRIRKPSA